MEHQMMLAYHHLDGQAPELAYGLLVWFNLKPRPRRWTLDDVEDYAKYAKAFIEDEVLTSAA